MRQQKKPAIKGFQRTRCNNPDSWGAFDALIAVLDTEGYRGVVGQLLFQRVETIGLLIY